MNEISCLIKEETTIDDNAFFIIQEIDSKREHLIPKNQIQVFKNIESYKEFEFLKEFNPNHNKTYLYITHPKFKIGQERDFQIKNIIEVDNRKYFEIESDFIVPLTVKALQWQLDLKTVRCKVVGYKRGRPRLKNVQVSNKYWAINEVYEFKIIGFGKLIDKSENEFECVELEVKDTGDTIEVRTLPWQNAKDWKFETIKCKVIGIYPDGTPKLITFDSRHPHYSIGKAYDFSVIGFQDKTSYKGFDYKIILLSDKFNNQYEVLAIPNQENRLETGEVISCSVENINTRLHLKQVNSKDPFFYEFDVIVQDDFIKQKFFTNYLNDNDEYNLKLKSQYEQNSGFWVFTYCNYILTKIKYEEANRKNLKEVINVIELHNKFENWILSSGILRAIKDDEERKLTKLKTKQIIVNNNLEKSIINYILNFKQKEFYKEQEKKLNFRGFFYFLKHSHFETFDEIEFLHFLDKIKTIDKEQKYILKWLIVYINKSLEIYKSSLKQEHFVFSQSLNNIQKKEITKYINWLYIQIKLSSLADLVVESNILSSKFYRFNTLLNNNSALNEKLLLNAFYFVSNPTDKHIIPVQINNNKIEILYKEVSENPNESIKLDLDGSPVKAKIIQKHYNGFKCTINDINGFLPFQNIFDTDLKYYTQENLDWESNVKINLYCSRFQYFICQQFDVDSVNYYSKNLKQNTVLKIGDVISGVVKCVKTFDSNNTGIFISTEYGDGLLHQNQISDSYYNFYDYKTIFSLGDKIPVYFMGYNGDKLNLGFKQLIGTEYENDYYDILNQYGFDLSEDLTEEEFNNDFRIEVEKGFIFEQFAFFQESIEEKIKYVKFAKAFFSKTKNARSYLLNIYIEYFNSINKLDELIQNYSIQEYGDFRNYIVNIKDKIQTKTLESFPESKNLIFFIDILYLFNSRDENDLELIFQLVKRSIQENEILLKAVAKTVLSNNLLLSEINDEDLTSLNDYTLKNLKRIREYIAQGVLSVKETIEDKREKELKEKRNYWIKKINEDEGEKLEFKSTFKTPVPTNEQNRIIESLEKQLKNIKSIEHSEKIKENINEVKNLSKNVIGIDKIIIHSALKTICAFANTNGGQLLIGVSDDKKIFGLEQDYKSFKNEDQNRDGFGKFFDLMIENYFGNSFSSTLLEKEFLKFPKGDILIVNVKKSYEEVFLLKNEKGSPEESIYVRNLSSSVKLKGIELSKFLKNRFREQLINTTEQ
ncbi:MAG: putative DNA binding domain-containing protein [Flavobacteriaceae bacterium]|nr:putative DNA binding domain-containing protein [Flavobacteriaceae bacterium]